MSDTLFEKISKRELSSWIVWEDEKFIAFLTPFANTPGQTVVVPKTNPGDNMLEIDDEVYLNLMKTTKLVAKILKQAFGVERVAVVIEGTGIPHVHVKLYPLHGEIEGKVSHSNVFYNEYQGYITTQEGPRTKDEDLNRWQNLILSVQKNLA